MFNNSNLIFVCSLTVVNKLVDIQTQMKKENKEKNEYESLKIMYAEIDYPNTILLAIANLITFI